MHIGGGVARSLIYADPFLADPVDPTEGRIYSYLFKKFGP